MRFPLMVFHTPVLIPARLVLVIVDSIHVVVVGLLFVPQAFEDRDFGKSSISCANLSATPLVSLLRWRRLSSDPMETEQ
jgi:hypothetical protein